MFNETALERHERLLKALCTWADTVEESLTDGALPWRAKQEGDEETNKDSPSQTDSLPHTTHLPDMPRTVLPREERECAYAFVDDAFPNISPTIASDPETLLSARVATREEIDDVVRKSISTRCLASQKNETFQAICPLNLQ